VPRAGLTAAAVTDAAAELVDAEGASGLTLHAVADRLGVRAPSLYAHVGGLEDLRRRVSTLAAERLGDAVAPAAVGLARAEALRALALAYRRWVLEHPGLYELLEPAGLRAEPAVDRVLDIVRAVLRGYGLDDEETIHAARALRSALHGFCILESSGGFQIPTPREESFSWMLDLFDRGLAG
jgi:AcrR family transcriptional regulator